MHHLCVNSPECVCAQPGFRGPGWCLAAQLLLDGSLAASDKLPAGLLLVLSAFLWLSR